jgi:hypothetical protein
MERFAAIGEAVEALWIPITTLRRWKAYVGRQNQSINYDRGFSLAQGMTFEV